MQEFRHPSDQNLPHTSPTIYSLSHLNVDMSTYLRRSKGLCSRGNSNAVTFLKIFLLYSSTQKPAKQTSSSGGWGWGGWASVLSQATASVTSGLSSVIETVETSLGVPDPEEMARKVREEEQAVKEKALEKRKGDETLVESNNKNVNKDAASGGYRQNNVNGKKYLT